MSARSPPGSSSLSPTRAFRRHRSTTTTTAAASASTTLPLSSKHLTAETVAALPPPGLSGPTSFVFSPGTVPSSSSSPTGEATEASWSHMVQNETCAGRYLSFVTSHLPTQSHQQQKQPMTGERRLCVVDMCPFYRALLEEEQDAESISDEPLPEYYFDATNHYNHHATQHTATQHNNGNDASFTTAASSSPEKSRTNKNVTTVASIPYSNPWELYSHSHVTCLLSSNQSSQLPSYHPPTAPPAVAVAVAAGSDLFQSPSGESAGSLASLSLLANHNKNNTTTTTTAQQSETHTNNNNNNNNQNNNVMSLEERLRRERQRIHSGGGLTQFTWGTTSSTMSLGNNDTNRGGNRSMGLLRLLVPLRGNLYLQDGVASEGGQLKLVYDKRMLATTILRNRSRPSSSHFIPTTTTTTTTSKPGNKRHRHGRKSRRRRRHHHTMANTVERHDSNVSGRSSGGGSSTQQQQQHPSTSTVDDGSGSAVGRDSGAIDAQLSPDGTMVAFVVAGEMFVSKCPPPDNGPANYWNESGELNYDMQVEDGDSGPPSYSLPVRLTYGALPDDWIVENRDDASLSSDSAESSWDDTMEDETDGDAAAAATMESFTCFEQEPCVTHGLADFVAQEEMDRYRGFWWDPSSTGILFAKVDESMVPAYRITHQGRDGLATDESTYEDHRYPFAGASNPSVRLGYVSIDRPTILGHDGTGSNPAEATTTTTESELDESFDFDMDDPRDPNSKGGHSTSRSMNNESHHSSSHSNNNLSVVLAARKNWSNVQWFDAPPAASEYLARACWLPDGTACAQWQNREQSTLLLVRMDVRTGQTMTLLGEQREAAWINLHHMLRLLPRAIHPEECIPVLEDLHPYIPSEPLPDGSFSFLFASERTGFQHLYLYTYLPGNSQATLIRTVSAGDWMVESIAGVDVDNDTVYVTGTFDSPLERHLYALPLTNRGGGEGGVEQYDNSRSIPVSSQHVGPSQGGDSGSGGNSGGGVRRGLKQVINVISGGGIKTRRNSSNASKSHGDSIPLLETSRTRSSSIVDPVRLTTDPGMHNVILDDECRAFVDTSSDIGRPTSVKVFALPFGGPLASYNTSNPSNHNGKYVDQSVHGIRLLFVLYDATFDDRKMVTGTTSSFGSPRNSDMASSPRTAAAAALNQTKLPSPELLSFPTSDGTETLHAALYKPDPRVHGPGPYPLICAVYGGPHVQRVNRSWSQCADMRAQRLCSLGFAVVKCDNRGSSRRGLAFESSIRHRLGRLEVLDQVTAVRHLTSRGIADSNRVGIYGWSYGGYLSAMCLCRAPDVFHVAVAGAPVTSWDGYDTHYTERYMGLPSENVNGYRESAVFEHVPNMRGKLMIVHGLIDENVHFRHSARLINRLIASSKDYDLLIFPEERHSPRRLRDRIYMEQRISDYFIKNLLSGNSGSSGNNNYGRNHHSGGPYQQREVMSGRL